jgi:hypothetical protein
LLKGDRGGLINFINSELSAIIFTYKSEQESTRFLLGGDVNGKEGSL